MNFRSRKISFLWWSIPLSIALHLLLLLLIPEKTLLPTPDRDEPVMVEVRPPQEETRPRELDIPPQPEPPEPRKEPAKRLGPQDMQVEKETAPKGEDTDDMAPTAPPAPSPPRPTPKPEPQETEPKPKKAEPAETAKPIERPAEKHEAELAPSAVDRPSSQKAAPAAPDQPLPKIDDLLDLPQSTASRITGEERHKRRPDVAEGDAIWLDTEKDLLISFFQRFKANIYGVWNYPIKAAERGEQGTTLLRITVRRDGSVESVKLEESSGSNTLDREAIRAVWTGASYGPLPRAYEEETLTIFAFFQYTLGGRPFVHGGR